MSSDVADNLARARQAIAECDALLIAAGAGMGVDSGLPDFRGPEGFWRAYPAFAKLHLRFEEIANPRWFDSDPHLAWGFYGHRANHYRRTTPHCGFATLLAWAKLKREFFVFTSNVDGHFQRAGFPADRIIECHGSIDHIQCASPCCSDIWNNIAPIEVDEATIRASEPLPRCPHCGEMARPNVLMFEDTTWVGDRTEQQSARFQLWIRSLDGKRLAIIECGAGKAIPTVQLICEQLTSRGGATLIRINPHHPKAPAGSISLAIPAWKALQSLAIEESI